jgi:MOSC domain-containing protein YiiM
MEIKQLLEQYAQHGAVSAIILRPGPRRPVVQVKEVEAIAGQGLKGDRYKASGGRQVTLIQQEHLPVVGSYLGKSAVDPTLLRRNIVVSGINLLTLKGKKFRLGQALLEYSGECHPCSRMEENLGTGGYNAMRGHGGILARILETGMVRVGDSVVPIVDVSENKSSAKG